MLSSAPIVQRATVSFLVAAAIVAGAVGLYFSLKALMPCAVYPRTDGLSCHWYFEPFSSASIMFTLVLAVQGVLVAYVVQRHPILIAAASAVASLVLAGYVFGLLHPAGFVAWPADAVVILLTPAIGAVAAWVVVKRHRL